MDRHEHANLVKIKYVILFQCALSYVLSYIFKKMYLLGAHFWQVTSLIWRWGLRLLGFLIRYIGTPKSSNLSHLNHRFRKNHPFLRYIGTPKMDPNLWIFHKPHPFWDPFMETSSRTPSQMQGIAVPARHAVPWATQIFAQ